MNKLKALHLIAVVASAISSAVIGFLTGGDPVVTGSIGAAANTMIATIAR